MTAPWPAPPPGDSSWPPPVPGAVPPIVRGGAAFPVVLHGTGPLASSGPPPAPSTARHAAVRGLPAEGDEIDGYRILSTIGRGSMGRVYRARDPLGRDVALKVILGSQADAEGLQRFTREGQAMAAVPRHRNVVNVHTTGTARGLPYLVLDLVEGESLADVLKRGRMRVVDAVGMTIKLARAVHHVHSAGVLHRDLKPANILIRKDDREPVLSDFGMAGLRGADRLTRTGDLLGTPLYMPPEQVLGMVRMIDARSDVWALGVMLYEMLAGVPPFTGRTLVEVSRAITSNEPPPIEGIDPGLMGVIQRALAKRREDRFPSAAALADALATWGAGEAPPPPPPPPRRNRLTVGLAVAAAAGAALGGAALFVAARRRRAAPEAQAPAVPSATPDAAGSPARIDDLGPLRVVEAQAPAVPSATPDAAGSPARIDDLGPLRVVEDHVRAGRSLQALARLNQDRQELRRGVTEPQWLAAAESVRAHALTLCRADDLDLPSLSAALQVLGRLRELGGLPVAPDELVDAVLERVRARFQALDDPAFDGVDVSGEVELVEAIAASGLRPADVVAAQGALHVFRRAYTPPDSRMDLELFQRLLVAAVRLDLDLFHDHVARMALVPDELSRSPYGEFLNLRIAWDSQDISSRAARNVQLEVAHQMRAFLDGPRAAALGPTTRGRALTMAAHAARTIEERLAVLDQAAALDPRSPRPLVAKARTLLDLAQLERTDEARRAQLLREATAAAVGAQERLGLDGFDAWPSVRQWEAPALYSALADVYVVAEEWTRVRQVLERIQALNPEHSSVSKLRAALDARAEGAER